jgi:hypothetical protein
VIGVGLAEAVRAMLGLVEGWAPCGSRLRLRGNGIEEASETGGRCGRGRVSGSKLVQLAAGSDFPPRYLRLCGLCRVGNQSGPWMDARAVGSGGVLRTRVRWGRLKMTRVGDAQEVGLCDPLAARVRQRDRQAPRCRRSANFQAFW